MKRGKKSSAEQIVLMLRQIEVQTAQGKSIAVACKEADVSEQSYRLQSGRMIGKGELRKRAGCDGCWR